MPVRIGRVHQRDGNKLAQQRVLHSFKLVARIRDLDAVINVGNHRDPSWRDQSRTALIRGSNVFLIFRAMILGFIFNKTLQEKLRIGNTNDFTKMTMIVCCVMEEMRLAIDVDDKPPLMALGTRKEQPQSLVQELLGHCPRMRRKAARTEKSDAVDERTIKQRHGPRPNHAAVEMKLPVSLVDSDAVCREQDRLYGL